MNSRSGSGCAGATNFATTRNPLMTKSISSYRVSSRSNATSTYDHLCVVTQHQRSVAPGLVVPKSFSADVPQEMARIVRSCVHREWVPAAETRIDLDERQ